MKGERSCLYYPSAVLVATLVVAGLNLYPPTQRGMVDLESSIRGLPANIKDALSHRPPMDFNLGEEYKNLSSELKDVIHKLSHGIF